MAYYFFLGDTMLPVPPPKMSVKIGNKNRTINLINEGEVNILKSPGLTEISFDAMLPNKVYPFADYSSSPGGSLVSAFFGNSFSYQPADTFMEAMQSAKKNREPVRFIVTRLGENFRLLWDTNMLVSVEECPFNEDAKQGNDVTVPIRLKEYRAYGTKEVEVSTDENGKQTVTVKETRQTDKTIGGDWKITKEKSLLEAVKLASGGSLNWRSIANLNGLYNPCEVLKKGTVIRLG